MEALRFTGSGSEYFKIWIVNVLLTIITLGIYYPWAKVRNRRYFYANSTLEDRNFEYHATGKQLFLGYMLGVMFFIFYNILGQANPLLSVGLMLLLFIAIPWLIWRSLMFNMRVTSFSNVHFSFKGTLGKAYVNYFLYPFLAFTLFFSPLIFSVVVTNYLLTSGVDSMDSLDILLPVAMIVAWVGAFYLIAVIKKRNTEYRLNGLYYGQGRFKSDLVSKKFLMINLKALGIFILFAIGIGTLFGLMGGNEILQSFNNPETMKQHQQLPEGFVQLFVMGYGTMLLVVLLLSSYIISRQRTYIYGNTTLDEKINFSSTLRARELAWVMFSNFLLIIITFGLAFPWTKVRTARLMLENTLVDTSVGFNEYLTQKEDEVSAFGDQIGEAFDIDIDIGF
jgi:uncharacterized membrane protein YjgN (DUF898 family)